MRGYCVDEKCLTRVMCFCQARGIPVGHAQAIAVLVQAEKKPLQEQVVRLRKHLKHIIKGPAVKAKITINQTQVLDMIRKSNPGLTNLRVVVSPGYEDRFDPRGGSPPSFEIEADVEVSVPVLDGGK